MPDPLGPLLAQIETLTFVDPGRDLASVFAVDSGGDCGVYEEADLLGRFLSAYRAAVVDDLGPRAVADADRAVQLTSGAMQRAIEGGGSEALLDYAPMLRALVGLIATCRVGARPVPPLATVAWDAVVSGSYALGLEIEEVLSSSPEVLLHEGIPVDRAVHFDGSVLGLHGRTIQSAAVVRTNPDDPDEGLVLQLDDGAWWALEIVDDGGVQAVLWDYPGGPPATATRVDRQLDLRGVAITGTQVQAHGTDGFTRLVVELADGRRLVLALSDPARLGTARVSMGSVASPEAPRL